MTPSIEKTKSSSMRDYFPYLFGRDPQDEWIFTINENKCRFLNGWRSGASLYINGEEVDRNNNLIAIDIKKPLVSGKIINNSGDESIVSIHMKAILGIKIQIKYNNEFIHNELN